MIEHLSGNPEDIVIYLHSLLENSGGPTDPHAEVLDALVTALFSSKLDYRQRRAIYTAAMDRADVTVARLLLDSHTDNDQPSALSPQRALIPRTRPISLGERKSLARGPRTDRLLHLIRDPPPDAIKILLGNPHIIERDVLAIASRRPTQPACQNAILASDKWRARYRVKRTLVFNPHSPMTIGIRLAVCLNNSDLNAIRHDSKLTIPTRIHAGALLNLRLRRQ